MIPDNLRHMKALNMKVRKRASERSLIIIGPLYRQRVVSVTSDILKTGQEYVVAEQPLRWQVGGSAVNMAFEIVRIGERCAVVGAWNREWAVAQKQLPQKHSQIAWHVFELHGRTGCSVGIRLRGGDATFITELGVNRQLNSEQILSVINEVEGIPLVMICGYSKLKGLHKTGLQSIADAVHKRRGLLGMDTGRLGLPIEQGLVEMLVSALDNLDVFLPNNLEAIALANEDLRTGLESAQSLGRNFRNLKIVLKMGSEGAAIIRNGMITSKIPAKSVAVASEEDELRLIGAGDAFNASFLAEAWLKEQSEMAALEAALTAAGLYVCSP